MSDINLDRIQGFIDKCQWGWAASEAYRDIPHEYIVRRRCALTDSEFVEFVKAQREFGIHERWGSYNNQYLYVGGYKYWTMGDTIPNTIIMNRQKLFDEFDNIITPYPEYYTSRQGGIIAEALAQFDCDSYFEIGCGDGKFLDYFQVNPARYYGIDPSKNHLAVFKKRNGFYRRCCCKAFENITTTKLEGVRQLVFGVFGSPSYVMKPYLDILYRSGCQFFLMFYKEGFVPEVFKEMHSFPYSEKELSKLFPISSKGHIGDYLYVSSSPINWEKAKTDYASKHEALL